MSDLKGSLEQMLTLIRNERLQASPWKCEIVYTPLHVTCSISQITTIRFVQGPNLPKKE